ncbi:unnamed protein product [Rhizophagus irregularis]|uniref:S-adenosyl-L-methionine-dependent methyltransferase n=1 Tax=Rhizophagus irregularis TaxID=588596 RepID=A0A2I1G816_9GLOM|nr:S-adenosyl-L-methionine-dependent methyltransferase [Rhizophagus irregularis]CAB4425645.1 unnamed protein product [Rhizophagus irregularis]
MGTNNSKINHAKRKSTDNNYQIISTEQLSPKTSDEFNTKKFKYIEGRRFHNWPDVHYDLPNDETEIDRLHLEHFLLRDVWQSNFSSPIHEQLVSGCNVLDVGCGPGAWCLDMATTFKNSKFYGLDISPIFPSEIKPKNAIFQECQILDGIPHKDQTFDFCHMRFMFPSFDENQWRTYVIKEVGRVLKPGGYLEIAEYKLCENCGPILKRLLDLRCEMMSNIGRNPNIASLLGDFMRDTDLFEEIIYEEKIIETGSWGGKLGEVAKDDIFTRMHAIKPALMNHIKCSGLGITSEDYDEMMNQCINEFNEYKTYFVTCRWYGKKL